jgi:Ca2+-binding EF-hand superfamily protein
LDFGEFLTAIAVTVNGSTKEKLTCAFKIYDLNSDGELDRRELKKILGHIYDMLGEENHKSRRSSKITDKQIELIFDKFNLKKNEKLTLDNFIEGCLRDEYLENLFKHSNYASLSTIDESKIVYI